MRHFVPPARLLRLGLCAALLLILVPCTMANAENRHVEKRVPPVYPELARRMHITGVVRINASVAADGSVTEAKATSGNQILTSAAEDAVRKWKFAQADAPSTEVVEVNFTDSN